LKPGESTLLDVPPNARSLVLSGANMPRLGRGTMVGEVNAMPIRIGDVADWGAFRREDYHASRNALPHNPAGMIRGYGYSAWIDGAGRVPASGVRMRVSADAHLPRDARLQIEAFELE